MVHERLKSLWSSYPQPWNGSNVIKCTNSQGVIQVYRAGGWSRCSWTTWRIQLRKGLWELSIKGESGKFQQYSQATFYTKIHTKVCWTNSRCPQRKSSSDENLKTKKLLYNNLCGFYTKTCWNFVYAKKNSYAQNCAYAQFHTHTFSTSNA